MEKIGNNKRQNDIKSLKINNNITSNSQEFPNSFNIRPLSVAVTVIGNIKKITVILGITWNLPNARLTNLITHF